jgi:hypothetical protein
MTAKLIATIVGFVLMFSHLKAHAKPELPPLEAKLYRYVASTQARDVASGRSYGTWHAYSKLGPAIFSDEANSFLTAKQLLALSEVHEHFEMPWYDSVVHLANQSLILYVRDADLTHEPSGTIAYYPIVDYSTGRRGIDAPISKMISFFNVPDDFDSSSQAFLWFLKSSQESSYVTSFLKSVTAFRDLNRGVVNDHDRNWKNSNSGAFMTWADPDRARAPQSRIFDSENDVDCVVDLNILTALGAYHHAHALPVAAEDGVRSTCRTLNAAVAAKLVPTCGFYYDRSSQFWIAFAQARLAGISCLEPSIPIVASEIQNHAEAIAKGKAHAGAVEIAEMIVSLKRLYPASTRGPRAHKVLVQLDTYLRSLIKIDGAYAYPATEDSLYLVQRAGIRLDWYSPAYAASLSLLALALP